MNHTVDLFPTCHNISLYDFSRRFLPGIQVFLGCINVQHLLQPVSHLRLALVTELVVTHTHWPARFYWTEDTMRETELL